MRSAEGANHVANRGDPGHDEMRIKQTRPYLPSGVRQVVPPKEDTISETMRWPKRRD